MTQTDDQRAELAIMIPVLAVGGAERVVAELLAGLPRERYRLSLLTLAGRPSAFEVPADVRVEPIRARSFMAALPSVARILGRRPPDLLCTHMTLPSIWGIAGRTLTRGRFPIVCVEHNTPSEEYSHETARRRLLPLLMRAAYPRADRLVAISEEARRDLAALLRRPEDSIELIRNPVLSPRIEALADEQPDHPWLADSDLKVVLSVGRLVPQKDHALLLRAFARVAALDPSARLLVHGEGPLRAELESLARAEGVAASVALAGLTSNPYSAMRRARVVAFSSRYEGSPLVAIEALACGAPVVATDVGDLRSLLDGPHGQVVAPGDAPALAEAILGFLSGERRPRAPRELLEPFDVDTGVAAYDALFSEVLSGARRDRAS